MYMTVVHELVNKTFRRQGACPHAELLSTNCNKAMRVGPKPDFLPFKFYMVCTATQYTRQFDQYQLVSSASQAWDNQELGADVSCKWYTFGLTLKHSIDTIVHVECKVQESQFMRQVKITICHHSWNDLNFKLHSHTSTHLLL